MERRLAILGEELAVLHGGPLVEQEPHDTGNRGEADPAPDPAWQGEPGGEPSWAGGGVPGWVRAAEAATATPASVEESPVVTVRAPGRHAARRARPGPGTGLLGRSQFAVIAVAVALALAITGWWVLRTGSTSVPLATSSASPLATPLLASIPGGQGSAPAEPSILVVDVAGRVRHPGIAVLEPGARVVDALDAAGGARPGVDLSSLNLARRVVDGEQILVGVPGGQVRAAETESPSGSGGEAPLVNINTAGQAELEALPEVGPVTAVAIISWREAHGGFSSIDQLLDVDGIGEATLSSVTPFVTV